MRRIIYLMAALTLLNIADLLLTLRGLSLGAVELNSVMLPLLQNGYGWHMKIIGLSIAFGASLYSLKYKGGCTIRYTWMYAAFCLLYTGVVVNNLLVVLRLGGA